jgi:hypothetical protein
MPHASDREMQAIATLDTPQQDQIQLQLKTEQRLNLRYRTEHK